MFVAGKRHVKRYFENTYFVSLNSELGNFDIVIEAGEEAVNFEGKFVVDKAAGAVG